MATEQSRGHDRTDPAVLPDGSRPERYPPETMEEYLLDALERLDASEMRADHLTTALVHSRTIGAAVGVLMTTHKITEVEAFGRLREASMAQNRKLYVLAQEVVDRGAL
jgi:hypothetical protein